MHDLPYQIQQTPETIACMTRVCRDAVSSLSRIERDHLLLGIQILAAGNTEAIAVAQAAGEF